VWRVLIEIHLRAVESCGNQEAQFKETHASPTLFMKNIYSRISRKPIGSLVTDFWSRARWKTSFLIKN